MRIALILPGFSTRPDDWAIPALLNLARTLAQRHELHIFSQRYPATGLYHFAGLTHHALGGGQRFGLASLKIWLQTARAVISQHRRAPFDVLHAFWVDEAGFAATLAGKRIKRPVVVSLGGGELTHRPDIGYGAQRFLVRHWTTAYALKRASQVTAGSTYQLDLCRQHQVPPAKLRLAPLGVDTQRFQPPGRLAKTPTLIQVASLLPVKNQRLLLEVLHLVKQACPDIRLNLVGNGPQQNMLEEFARRLDVDQNIMWHYRVPYPELVRIYQQAHLYVQTSHHESQGMAVLEGMACGLPLVGTPVGVARDLACLPSSAWVPTLAAQVSELLNDEAGYNQARQTARTVVERDFSLAKTTGNFEKLYEQASS